MYDFYSMSYHEDVTEELDPPVGWLDEPEPDEGDGTFIDYQEYDPEMTALDLELEYLEPEYLEPDFTEPGMRPWAIGD